MSPPPSRYPTVQLNILQRGLNKLGYRHGIFPFPIAFERGLHKVAGNRRGVFDRIYADN